MCDAAGGRLRLQGLTPSKGGHFPVKHKAAVRVVCLCIAVLMCVTLFGSAVASLAML